MAEEVKLFGLWGSPFSRRVEIALKIKGVKYEYIEDDLQNKSALLLKYNPVHKKVPVLLHNGKPIAESLVLLEYIDETWEGNPNLPPDPYERAQARFWAKFIDEKCLPTLWKALFGKESEQEKAMEEALQNLKMLEKELKDKRLFGGESIGLVDIAANFIAYWVGIIQEAVGAEILNRERFPVLYKWIDELLSCSVIRENLPPRDKMLAYFISRVQAAKASK